MLRLIAITALSVALAGCKPKPPTTPHCVSNTELQFKRIDENHAKYKAGERPSGAVYWARYYLETARFVLTGEGIDGSGAACTGADRDSKDYKRLLGGVQERQGLVEWMEGERGVKFSGISKGGVTWTWRKDGQPVAGNDANTL